MDHRYGRHGPDAWLKWRARHYTPPTMSPAPTMRTTVYVYNLSKTERIIYIIMADPNEVEASTDPQLQAIQMAARNGNEQKYLPSPDEIELKNSAANRASFDVADIKRKSNNGKIVHISWGLVREKAARYAQTHVKDTLAQEEYKRRIEWYEQLYDAFLREFLDKDQAIRYIGTPEQLKLREYANEDREINLQEDLWHIRDLAVLRVLQVTHLSPEQGLTALTALHKQAKFYQECYSSPREEVSWPPETFLNE